MRGAQRGDRGGLDHRLAARAPTLSTPLLWGHRNPADVCESPTELAIEHYLASLDSTGHPIVPRTAETKSSIGVSLAPFVGTWEFLCGN